MKIDIDAFLQSLPIMGVGLLGIFLVTIVIILGIYLLKAITSKAESAGASTNENDNEQNGAESDTVKGTSKKESAMDLMKDREKKDFLETDDSIEISQDL